jgi:hypothetical protein
MSNRTMCFPSEYSECVSSQIPVIVAGTSEVAAIVRKSQAASSVAFAFAGRKLQRSGSRLQFDRKIHSSNTRLTALSRQRPCRIHTRHISQHPPHPQPISSWPKSLNPPSLSTPSPSRPRVVMPPRIPLPPPTLAMLSLSSTTPRTSMSSTLSPTPGPSGSPSLQVERYLTSITRNSQAHPNTLSSKTGTSC